jgi:type I restriction-modification system DNA methylase subunit
MAEALKQTRKLEVHNQPHFEVVSTSSHNPFWQSSLFNDVYLLNDAPVKFKEMWEMDEAGPFYIFCNQFRNLCEELKGADLESWSERNTINRFIKPVLEMLGYTGSATQEPWAEDEPFTVKENGETKVYKPDLIIVHDPKELKYIERKKGDEKLEEARQTVIVPVEAKYWGRIEDVRQHSSEDSKRADKKDQSDATRALDFDEQCLKYMEILHKDFGILTDGRTWRLYHRELSSDSYRRNFQFNLGYLMRLVNAGLDKSNRDYELFIENAKYFFHIFAKKALHSESGERLFVDDLLEYSKKYVSQVEDDLKSRFVKAVSLACNGFLRSTNAAKAKVDLETIRNVSESHLFNILLIRYCESKNILPMKDANYRKISISSTIDRINLFNPEKEEDNLNLPLLTRVFKGHFEYEPDGTDLYDRLLDLTKIVQEGTQSKYSGFEIKGFVETIFNRDEQKFIKSYPLQNSEMVQILFELGYCETKPGKYQQIPYSFFSPRQLGSIYESFLEFRLEKADEDMAFIKKQWVPANLSSEKVKKQDVPKVKKGKLFFSPNNKERKATGSYYTPDSVVQYIVRETLSPLVQGKSSKEIAKLRICDPAMGSAHFLSASLNFVARAYLAALERETNDDLDMTLLQAKRELLHNCIFGVDQNPRAVKLAKMSLWLESAEAGKELEELDDQIKCANSLTEENLWRKEWRFLEDGIDAVVGNPPYLGEKGHKEVFQEIASGWLGKRFYLGKMDLLYFFFHLGLDVLKEDGRLGFITTNYFTTALGGKRLREDLSRRANLDLLVNLNELKVFGEATGQHNMISIISRSDRGQTKPLKLINSSEGGQCSVSLLSEIVTGKSERTSISDIEASNVYDGDMLYIRTSSGVGSSGTSELTSVIEKLKKCDFTLAEVADVSTGIMGGCDYITKLNISYISSNEASSKDITVGDGVFVLDSENDRDAKVLKELKGSKFLKPFFKNSDIGKFTTSEKALSLAEISVHSGLERSCVG